MSEWKMRKGIAKPSGESALSAGLIRVEHCKGDGSFSNVNIAENTVEAGLMAGREVVGQALSGLYEQGRKNEEGVLLDRLAKVPKSLEDAARQFYVCQEAAEVLKILAKRIRRTLDTKSRELDRDANFAIRMAMRMGMDEPYPIANGAPQTAARAFTALFDKIAVTEKGLPDVGAAERRAGIS